MITRGRRSPLGAWVVARLGPAAQWVRLGPGRLHRAVAAPEFHRTVRPLSVAIREPRSLAERSALAFLHRQGVVRLDTLVRCVARDLYVEELRQCGWAVDIGVLGPMVFVPNVAHEIAAADGALWEIGGPAGSARTS